MKITVLSGLQASGKSTLTKEMVEKNSNYGRVNRDQLRQMVFNGNWTPKREKIIVEMEKAIATVLLKHSNSVVVDDTNVNFKNKQFWESFAKEQKVEHELIKIETDLATCIERDRLRTESEKIGEAIIQKFALSNGFIDWGDKKIIVCDLDGCIANEDHRAHFRQTEKKDWNSYFAGIPNDTVYQEVVDMVNRWSATHTIVLSTGRPDTTQHETLAWLRNVANVKFDYLFMRNGSDRRPASFIKLDILNKLPKHKIEMVLDDSPTCVRMYREQKLKVIPVRGMPDEHQSGCEYEGQILKITCPSCGIIGDF